MSEAQFHVFVAYMFVWSGVMITVILRDNRRIRRDIEAYRAGTAEK